VIRGLLVPDPDRDRRAALVASVLLWAQRTRERRAAA
jgi:hypothetical protein